MKEQTNTEELRKQKIKENQAWIKMFNEMTKTFNISKEELNKLKYREMFKLIEFWAYEDRKLRELQKELEEHKGVFID